MKLLLNSQNISWIWIGKNKEKDISCRMKTVQRPRDRNESHAFWDCEQTAIARHRYKLEKKESVLIGSMEFGS